MISIWSRPEVTSEVEQQIDRICDEFELAWRSSKSPQIVDYLGSFAAENRKTLFCELLRTEVALRRELAQNVDPQPYYDRFPDMRSVVDSVFAEDLPTAVHSQAGQTPVGSNEVIPEFSAGHRIGDYAVVRKLGEGGFGVVYLARDLNLDRDVALKIARPKVFQSQKDLLRFRKEAQSAAQIAHPGVATIYSVMWDNQPPVIVQEYVEGTDLKTLLRIESFSAERTVELVAELAETIAFAHQEGIYHRDLKPGNVMISTEGRARIVDFGLAIYDSERRQHRGEKCGTPAYMAPEQVRGESHRLDGRCDIWSLGIILYQMLVGKTPFSGDTQDEVYEEVLHNEVRPPRQLKPQLPLELERICLKCLAKRMSDRYTTAHDLATDLRELLTRWPSQQSSHVFAAGHPTVVTSSQAAKEYTETSPKIIPKGLRSFDEHDADFFLELLPGPRDRLGVPESIRFWKTRIEEADSDSTFPVGLIYGPSGCGKSSFIRAGLLPRLAGHIIALYVEAGRDENATNVLLKQLRKRFPEISPTDDLTAAITQLRIGTGLPEQCKVLLVIDQFEQWLHGNINLEDSPLVQALRQCDGGRVQALILVRDDFWLAISRFMRAIEVGVVEGNNSALVDLLDRDHATTVLEVFGQAYGRIPGDRTPMTAEQKVFLTESVSALAEDGKVNCVRLALFAEMMKSKAWTPENLKRVGGVEGVGTAFLDDRFVAPTAPPGCRLHQLAARAVLSRLLPESGTDIRGHMRSHADLMQASGYSRSRDFEELVQILDAESRLITPCERTDPELAQSEENRNLPTDKYYQLTHDYLVPSIRTWLTRKKRETHRGRAELLLETVTADWSARVDHRRLPTVFEWLTLRLLTNSREWNPAQNRMMAAADRRHLSRFAIALALLLCFGFVGNEAWRFLEKRQREMHDRELVSKLLAAKVTLVSEIISELEVAGAQRPSVIDLVRAAESSPTQTDEGRFNAQLFLAPYDPTVQAPLMARLLIASPEELDVIRSRLATAAPDLTEKLWQILREQQRDRESQLRAACALAALDPTSSNWSRESERVAIAISHCQTGNYSKWIERFVPIGHHLLPTLSRRFRDENADLSEKLVIATAVVQFVGKKTERLAEIALDATADSFPILLTGLKRNRDDAIAAMRQFIANSAVDESDDLLVTLTRRKAVAAISLLQLEAYDDFWRLLTTAQEPALLTAITEACAPFGVDPHTLLGRLDLETANSSQAIILLSLGGYLRNGSNELKVAIRDKCLVQYEQNTSSGVHFAAEWLLQQLEATGDATSTTNRQVVAPPVAVAADWQVTPHGISMVVVRGPQDFLMGSPSSEAEREENLEEEHAVHLDHSFAIGAYEVTVEQFQKALPGFDPAIAVTDSPHCPMSNVNWYEAAKFCRRLSEAEGISELEMVYPPVADIQPGMKLRLDWQRRTGYRLPSDEEWECACRAGTKTVRFFGDSPARLGAYARYIANSDEKLWPVGSCRPNPWGLFDVYGNVLEWCHDPREVSPPLTVANDGNPESKVVIRSGSYRSVERENRSAKRYLYRPNSKYAYTGFRVARTIRDP